jgi:hypothetical protein
MERGEGWIALFDPDRRSAFQFFDLTASEIVRAWRASI